MWRRPHLMPHTALHTWRRRGTAGLVCVAREWKYNSVLGKSKVTHLTEATHRSCHRPRSVRKSAQPKQNFTRSRETSSLWLLRLVVM
ncbi:hypothetical protein VZT92_016174 [Zoarces viviparus]|uniref:Secreted protein n=1 Tax=Zoarces viviparus TaxID=48416 RepID=A0AAW1EW06_ZOAVI